MSKAQAAATSNRKSSFSAAALVTTKDTLTFRLHPKQLVVANGSEGTCRERQWYRKMLERGLSRRVLPGLLAATHAVSFIPTAAASKQRILHHWPLAVLNKHVV